MSPDRQAVISDTQLKALTCAEIRSACARAVLAVAQATTADTQSDSCRAADGTTVSFRGGQ